MLIIKHRQFNNIKHENKQRVLKINNNYKRFGLNR